MKQLSAGMQARTPCAASPMKERHQSRARRACQDMGVEAKRARGSSRMKKAPGGVRHRRPRSLRQSNNRCAYTFVPYFPVGVSSLSFAVFGSAGAEGFVVVPGVVG